MIACGLVLTLSILIASGCVARTAEDTTRSDATQPAPAPAIDTSTLLRKAADHEALYTLAGGLKPMSTGIWRGRFRVDEPDLSALRRARAALAPLRNDAWYADVQVFDNIHDGSRSIHAFVVHRAALSRMIERYDDYWSPWGITPCTHPAEIVAVVDRMPRGDRWRGYGYLFGYPSYAVNFFVVAGLAAEDGRLVGPGKDREFMHVPTYGSDSGSFTYAVPLDHARSESDEALAREAARILAAYTERRGRMDNAASMIRELQRLNRRFESTAAHAAEIAAEQPTTGQSRGELNDAVLDTR